MKIKHYPIFAAFAVIPTAFVFLSNSNGPQAAVAGSPLEGGNNCTQCHGGTANSGAGSLQISGLTEYNPGETYTISVNINDESSSKFGFQAIALDADNNPIGTISAGTGTKIYTQAGSDYIEHSAPSTDGAFSFEWTAPETSEGDVTFYASGNASNGNNAVSGDNIYTASETVSPISSSIDEAKYNDLKFIQLSPGTIQLNLSDVEFDNVEVFNLNGQRIKQLTKVSGLVDLDIEKGIYIFNLSKGQQSVTKKIQVN